MHPEPWREYFLPRTAGCVVGNYVAPTLLSYFSLFIKNVSFAIFTETTSL